MGETGSRSRESGDSKGGEGRFACCTSRATDRAAPCTNPTPCHCRVLALWTSHMAALLAVRLTEGFRGLDSGAHRGPVRWEICYNMTLLRMLSYSLDLHWRRSRAAVLAASEKVLWGYLQGLPSCASH